MDLNHPPCFSGVAVNYINEHKNFTLGVQYLEKALELGDTSIIGTLANIYLHNIEVKNEDRAIKLLKQANKLTNQLLPRILYISVMLKNRTLYEEHSSCFELYTLMKQVLQSDYFEDLSEIKEWYKLGVILDKQEWYDSSFVLFAFNAINGGLDGAFEAGYYWEHKYNENFT